MLQRELWQISENVEFPPASLDSSIVDCRRIADEIPQKFRSQEWKAEPFCIETFQQQEESLSFGFQNEQQTTKNSTKPQIEFATQNDDDFSGSWCSSKSQLNFIEEIPKIAVACDQPQQFEDQYFENYAPLWNKLNDKDFWNCCDGKDATSNYSVQNTVTKPEQLFEYDKYEAYPVQENTPVETCQGTSYNSNNDCYQNNRAEYYFPDNTDPILVNNMQTCSALPNEFQDILPSAASSTPVTIGSLSKTDQTQGLNLNASYCTSNFPPAANQNSYLGYIPAAPSEHGTASLKSEMTNYYPVQEAAGALQQYAGYNLYTTPAAAGNIQKFPAIPVVGEESKFSQSTRDNPGIKFHIRTITHCEVECPAPNNLPLPNPPTSFLPAGNPQALSGSSGGQHFKQLKNLSDAISNSGVNNCNSWKGNDDTMSISNGLAPQSTTEIEVSHSNQILPFQTTAYANPFQNGVECPRLLVHEQRQTSILIGYPMTTSGECGNTSTATAQTGRESVAATNCQQAAQQNQRELQHQSQAGLNDNEQTKTRTESGAGRNGLILQTSQATLVQERENTIRMKPAIQPTDNNQNATQINSISSSSTNAKPSHLNFNSSYSPVFKFSPHSFPCLPSNPGWLSAKQSYSKFNSQSTPFEYIVPPDVNFNGNYKVRSNSVEHGFFEDKFSSAFDPSSSQHLRNYSWNARDNSKDIAGKNMKISSKKRNGKKSNKTEQKNLECSRCPKRFAKERDLQVHVNKHHLQMVKPYFCTFCSKCFKRPDQLKRHEKIHTGERPHLCSVCGRKFARTDHRNTHLKKHATSGLEKFSNNRKYLKADLISGRLSKNEADTTASSRSFEEVSVPTKESFLIPMRFDPVPGSYPPYFFSHPPLYENHQAPSYVPAVHQ